MSPLVDRHTPKSPLGLVLQHASFASLASIVLFSLIVNVLTLVVPMHMVQVYDRVLPGRSESTLLMLLGIAAFLLGTQALLDWARSRLLVRLGMALDVGLAQAVFSAVLRRQLSGTVASRSQPFRDIETIRNFVGGTGPVGFLDAPWVPIFLLVLALFHPVLGLIGLVGAVILLALAVLGEIATRKPLGRGGEIAIEANRLADTMLRNAETIEAMGMEAAVRRRWIDRHDDSLVEQARASDRAGWIGSLSKAIRLILQVVMLSAGAWLAIGEEISAGMIIAGSIVLGRALAPLDQMVGGWRNSAGFMAAARRVAALIAGPQEAMPMPLPRPAGKLAVDRVVAGPPGATKPVLKGVSFAIEPGEALAIVGHTGAGKSSLVRLLVGVWAAQAGQVRLDGAAMADWPKCELGRHIGYLPQEVDLLEGTVADNIARFGEIDAVKVVAAAREAGIHEAILALPQGYETRLGEGGRTLSGGQRQRIALARALYDTPVLLVLDEPNANLDSDGEEALARAIGTAKSRGATIVLVTHRPSLLAAVDKVLVLREGTVESFGPRAEVMRRLVRPALGKGSEAAPAAVQEARA